MQTMDLPEPLESVIQLPGQADLGPGPRRGALPERAIEAALSDLRPAPPQVDLIRALLLLWNDHHDEAHSVVQSRETSDGNLIHAILHRREPDYSNARYWFHRVGDHPSFQELGREAMRLLQKGGTPTKLGQLVPEGSWDPEAFVAACQRVGTGRALESEQATLREIQELETRALLRHLLSRPG